jgi:hypothetical protein
MNYLVRHLIPSCAFTMGLFRPDLYRLILTYSGTFVAQESLDNPKSPHGAWEYPLNFIPKSEPSADHQRDIGCMSKNLFRDQWAMAAQ